MSSPQIQQILRAGLQSVVESGALTPRVARIGNLLAECRSGALGFTIYRCSRDGSHGAQFRPNSCGNRNCRTCASTRIEKRLSHEREHFLDADHHQLVMTLPSSLRSLFRLNAKLIGDIMLRSTSTSVLRLLADKRYMRGTAGIVSFLHTWNQRMQLHPHVHLLVSSVGLSDEGALVNATMKRLLPHELLAAHWRSTFINMLRATLRIRRTEISYPHGMNEMTLRQHLVELKKDYWHVHTTPGVRSRHALKYNVAYSIGGCIGNRRVQSFDHDTVVIRARTSRDRRDTHGDCESVRLGRNEFITRLLSHVPEHQQRVIGHYGLYAQAASNAKLRKLRALLHMRPIAREHLTVRNLLDVFTHDAPMCCSMCGAKMYPRQRFQTGPPSA